jgi:serine/threonine-protein kinase
MATESDSRDDRRTLDVLFDRALDVPPEERSAFLDRVCAGRPDLRSQLDELLRLAASETSSPLPSLLTGPLWRELMDELQLSGASPRIAGRWRLLEEIGRGGMGTVFRAARDDGEFEQQAAVKLLSPDLESEAVLRRFARERQILAALDHPGIARLLDGGRTDSSQPYFVMELVDGQPIDRDCDVRRLTIRERLGLMLQVCRAVDHAHRNLVVHLDLKPSNILVTADGRVKLLDFGIAKLLAGDGAAVGEPLTRTLARPLTPEYASPEQILNHPVGVASDVYQLGVLLYRLLTGRPPYRLTGHSAREIERVVCELEPPRASSVVGKGELGEEAGAVAARRGTTPAKLARQLRGDLETIVAKALRKEPDRRFLSVAELAADLESHLDGRPVGARPDTLTYRAGKFVVRHRLAVTAAAVIVALLAAYAVTVTFQARALSRERDRARAEAAKAEHVKALILRLFEGADPREAAGHELTARELLDRGWTGIEGELADQPEVRVELMATVGDIHRELGLYSQADHLLTSALETARALVPGGGVMLAEVLRRTGRLRLETGEYGEAEDLLREALALYRQQPQDMRSEIGATLAHLGWTFYDRGDDTRAEALFRESLAIRRERFGNEHRDVAASLAEVGMVVRNRGEYAAAEPLLRQALDLRRRLLPESHPALADSLSSLATVKRNLGDLDAAEALYREALDLMIRTRGDAHAYVATVTSNLARVLQLRGALKEAEQLLRRALTIRREALGERHPLVAMNLNDLGRLLYDAGALDRAEALYDEALNAYPANHPWRSATVFNLGRVYETRGDYRSAERMYRQALAEQRVQYGEDHERVGVDLNQLGIVLYLQKRPAEAESHLRQAIAVFRKSLPPDHYRIAEALVPLGVLLMGGERSPEAEQVLREALEIRRAAFGEEDARTREVARLLGGLATPARRQ